MVISITRRPGAPVRRSTWMRAAPPARALCSRPAARMRGLCRCTVWDHAAGRSRHFDIKYGGVRFIGGARHCRRQGATCFGCLVDSASRTDAYRRCCARLACRCQQMLSIGWMPIQGRGMIGYSATRNVCRPPLRLRPILIVRSDRASPAATPWAMVRRSPLCSAPGCWMRPARAMATSP